MTDFSKYVPIFGPLYLTSIALCFDVGFFSGLGPAFFTIFSLTEHLLFALQAIPYALVPACTIISAVLFPLVFYATSEERQARYTEKFRAMSPQQKANEIARLHDNAKYFDKLQTPFSILQIILAAFMIWSGFYTTALVIIVCLAIPPIIYPNATLVRRMIVSAIVVLSGWVGAFTLGYERAIAIVGDKKPTEIVTMGFLDTPGKMIRAGEKGILFKPIDTGKVTYIRWDNIKRISGV